MLLILEGLDVEPRADHPRSQIPAATELAAVTSYISYAVGGHILLSYPSGRLRSSEDRTLVVLLYVAFGPAIIVCFAFHGDYGPGCPLNPSNAFLITPNDTLDVALNGAWFAVTGALMAVTGLRSVRAGARRRPSHGARLRRST